jgi:hypothetical protein
MRSSVMLRREALVRTDVSDELSVRRLLVTANLVPGSPILVTLMMEAPRSSETSGLTRGTPRFLQEPHDVTSSEDAILQYV